MAKTAASHGLCRRYHYAVELVGRRWTGAILRLLLDQPRRFAELAAGIPDLSDRMLAERLKELEQEGIVARMVVPEIPVRVEYSLPPMGRALDASLQALGKWAEEWLPEDLGAAETPTPAAAARPVKSTRKRA